MGKTNISWATHVWNPVTGCSKISPGCDHCYAERMARRLCKNPALPHRKRYENFKVSYWPERLYLPRKWNKPSRIFVNSMGDLFHKDVPFNIIDDVLMSAWNTPRHTFLFLTKRPDRLFDFYDSWNDRLYWGAEWLWFGITAENQEQFDKRISHLLKVPSGKYFVSIEPMLTPVDLTGWIEYSEVCENCGDDSMTGQCCGPDTMRMPRPIIDWVICGGETGPGARIMKPEWVRSLRDQCQTAGTPFFFKGWGEWRKIEPSTADYMRIGKKKAGNLLDGRTWQEFPK